MKGRAIMRKYQIRKMLSRFAIATTVIAMPAIIGYKLGIGNYTNTISKKNNNVVSRKVEKVNYIKDNENEVFFTCGLNGENEPGFIPSNEV